MVLAESTCKDTWPHPDGRSQISHLLSSFPRKGPSYHIYHISLSCHTPPWEEEEDKTPGQAPGSLAKVLAGFLHALAVDALWLSYPKMKSKKGGGSQGAVHL